MKQFSEKEMEIRKIDDEERGKDQDNIIEKELRDVRMENDMIEENIASLVIQ